MVPFSNPAGNSAGFRSSSTVFGKENSLVLQMFCTVTQQNIDFLFHQRYRNYSRSNSSLKAFKKCKPYCKDDSVSDQTQDIPLGTKVNS